MGSNDMPELGSRISLISKADIRYEGKLYTVDPQECTIALANVRSFGTEDRETAHPVPAQNQIYDYILFRATDIKDISVVPPQLLYDPAIVQLSALPSIGSRGGYQGGQGGQGGGGAFGGHSVLGGLSGGGGFQGGAPTGFNPMQSGLQGMNSRAAPAPPKCVLDLLTGSRSSTPGLRKVSPTVDQAIQANPRKLASPPKDKQQQQQRNQQQQLFAFRQRSGSGPNNLQRTNQPQQRPRNDSYQSVVYFAQNYGNQQQNRQHQQQQQQHHQQQQQGGVRWGGGGGGGGGRGGGRGIGGGGGVMRGGGGGSNRGRPQFSRAPGTGTKKPSQPLKFDADYDFDKANTEFEELRNQLAKVKIGEPEGGGGGGGGANINQQNGAGEEKKDDSGNETGIGEGEQEETETYYDKTKSFFDNISCEAIERSKGRSQRTDWRKERKLNSETFGVSMARRQGVYRGRGGYYSQGRGGGGYYQQQNRGGYRQHQQQPQFRQQQNKPRNTVPQLPSQQGSQVGVGC